jgi:Rps23 Pro-64 3,4-dihydroxylase Tpa1-like proline 4-hydroxylase
MLNQLYRDGFYQTSIPKDEADRLIQLVKADSFLPDKPGSPDIAEWETDNPSQNNAIPVEYLAFMESLGSGPDMEHMRCHMGAWSRVNVMLQRGKRGDSMGWHHDSYDPMFMVCMLYLTDEIWTPEDGGELLIGHGDVDEKGFLTDHSAVSVKGRISPNHGTLVWCINTNPRWVHRVTEIQSDKLRYSMIGQFGYRENVLRSNIRQRYGDTWR